MEIVVEALDLYKTYDGVNWALEDFSITARDSEVLALLGRNGAGKTTFVRIAATQLRQTKGEVRVLGYDVLSEAKHVRKRIAVVPQEGRPDSLTTPWEHVVYYLAARGISLSEAKARARRYLKELEMWEYRDVICSKLSGGLRQRTLVAMALATEAELTFLDEPTIGLDPISRINVWRVVKDAVKNDSSVILTTHNMEEAEVLASRVAIIEGGRLLAIGSIGEVKGNVRAKLRVEISSMGREEVEGYGYVIDLGSKLRVYTDERGARELVELAMMRRAEVGVSPISLEDVFISLVGRAIDYEG